MEGPRKKISGQIDGLKTNLISFIQDYNAMKLENQKLTKLVATDEHKRKLQVTLNDCREQLHKAQHEIFQKNNILKDLESQILQIRKENDETIKEKVTGLEELSAKLSRKTDDYTAALERLTKAESLTENLAEKNSNLKLEHEMKVEDLQYEILQLKRTNGLLQNEKLSMVQDLSTKLARTEENLIMYKEKLEKVVLEAQSEAANNYRKRKHYDEIIDNLQGENKKLKEEKTETTTSTPLQKPHTSPLLKKKDMGQVLRKISDEYGALKIPRKEFYSPPSPRKASEKTPKNQEWRQNKGSEKKTYEKASPQKLPRQHPVEKTPPQSPPWQYPVVSSQYDEIKMQRLKTLNQTNQKPSMFEPSQPTYQKKKISWEDEVTETPKETPKKIKSSVGIPCLNMLNFTNAPSKSTICLPSPKAWGDFPKGTTFQLPNYSSELNDSSRKVNLPRDNKMLQTPNHHGYSKEPLKKISHVFSDIRF